MASMPAGWYPDPSGSVRLRYFDGTRWTNYLSDAGPPQGAHTDDIGATTQRHTGVRRPLVFLILAIVAFLVAVAGFVKLMDSGDSEILIVGLLLLVVFAVVGAVLSAKMRAAKPAVRRLLVFLILAIVGYLIAVAAFVLQVRVSYYFWSDIKYPGMLLFVIGILGAIISAIMNAAKPKPSPARQIHSPVDQQAGSAPGWYPDPQDLHLTRYFDGRVWTSSTQPRYQ